MVEGVAMRLDEFPRLKATVARIEAIDPAWTARAEARLDRLTKPPGSLGRLEPLAARLCAIQRTLTPRTSPARIVVFAGDHGVAIEGVSAYPQAVTAQMVANFTRGGAAINALARMVAADLRVVDVGVAGRVDACGSAARFESRKVRGGTRNIARGPAMSKSELRAAIAVGLDVAETAASDGVAVLACGDMGIANSTAASAITAALTGASPAETTGRGTGIDDDTLAAKVAVVARALDVNRTGQRPLDALRTVGGFEIAAIAGACLGAAAERLVVVGDGFIATAAALAASRICPAFAGYWIAGHQSAERGHRLQLEALRAEPLLHLELRLGEGTGAALAIPLLHAAAALIAGMATFEAAGVSDRDREPAGEAAP